MSSFQELLPTNICVKRMNGGRGRNSTHNPIREAEAGPGKGKRKQGEDIKAKKKKTTDEIHRMIASCLVNHLTRGHASRSILLSKLFKTDANGNVVSAQDFEWCVFIVYSYKAIGVAHQDKVSLIFNLSEFMNTQEVNRGDEETDTKIKEEMLENIKTCGDLVVVGRFICSWLETVCKNSLESRRRTIFSLCIVSLGHA